MELGSKPGLTPEPLLPTTIASFLSSYIYPLNVFFFLILFSFLLLFRAAPVAYGSSQARGSIRATADLHHSHSNARSEPCL